MSNSCCGSSTQNNESNALSLDQTKAVEDRYGAAAHAKEACLYTPVSSEPKLLEVIPIEVVEKDYGCGDPTRWVKKGDAVLDLGSGGGKNAFIYAQIVGQKGTVIGIDRNVEMLELAKKAAPVVGEKIGFSNVTFIKGAIESLDEKQSDKSPLIPDSSIDLVISNCVLNLINPSNRNKLLRNIQRVLRTGGRLAISDIVSNKKGPLALQQDADLWSGCISGT